jgi:nicotinamidase/pyrazinamidase
MPGEMSELAGLAQVLWPDHCVQGSRGAEFHPGLDLSGVRIFRKGTDPEIDSYSGLYDNGHRRSTGLGEFLREQGVTDVYMLGIATDYCVKFSALDARRLGFEAWLIEDGCRGVNLSPDDSARAIDEMKAAGVRVISSCDL